MSKKLAPTKSAQAFISFTILSLLYLMLAIFLPPVVATQKSYNLSNAEYHVLALLMALPLIAVWFAAFYGYAKLEQYSRNIRNTADGKAFVQIGRGLRWLAWGLPIGSIVSNVLSGIAHGHPSFVNAAFIISHYVVLLISFVAFWIILGGTRSLSAVARKYAPPNAARALLAILVTLTVTYSYVTIRTVQDQKVNPYRLPMWLILLTIIVPYLYAWLMGLLAAYEISLYRKHVRGVFYKRALDLLTGGITLSILSAISLQYLTSSSPYLRRINLNWSLLVIYIVLTIYATGFILIAIGATKLKKIEEV